MVPWRFQTNSLKAFCWSIFIMTFSGSRQRTIFYRLPGTAILKWNWSISIWRQRRPLFAFHIKSSRKSNGRQGAFLLQLARLIMTIMVTINSCLTSAAPPGGCSRRKVPPLCRDALFGQFLLGVSQGESREMGDLCGELSYWNEGWRPLHTSTSRGPHSRSVAEHGVQKKPASPYFHRSSLEKRRVVMKPELKWTRTFITQYEAFYHYVKRRVCNKLDTWQNQDSLVFNFYYKLFESVIES